LTDPKKTSYRSVEITETDIEKAKQNDSYKCVVAQAIARTFPDAHHIEVDTQTIRFTEGYVVAFDAGEAIEPFTFQLRQPVPVRQKRRTKAGRLASRAGNRARRAAMKQPSESGDDPSIAARAAYRTAYAAEKESNPGPAMEPVDPSLRVSPPRVFKTKQRSYGMRVLRINREDAATPPTHENA
jgi:hypothetical protein